MFNNPIEVATGPIQLALHGGGQANCTVDVSPNENVLICIPTITTPKSNSYTSADSITGTLRNKGAGAVAYTTLPIPTLSTFSPTSSVILESVGLTTYTVTIPSHQNTVTLNYTGSGTANNTNDLTIAIGTGTLVFAPGETTKAITFTTTDDTVFEGSTPETVVLSFSNSIYD